VAEKPKPGSTVILKEVPPGLLDGLLKEDQHAISEAVGRKVLLNEYDELGRAELQFTSPDGAIHFIWVDPKFLVPAG
jgi:hypothetical protein